MILLILKSNYQECLVKLVEKNFMELVLGNGLLLVIKANVHYVNRSFFDNYLK